MCRGFESLLRYQKQDPGNLCVWQICASGCGRSHFDIKRFILAIIFRRIDPVMALLRSESYYLTSLDGKERCGVDHSVFSDLQ